MNKQNKAMMAELYKSYISLRYPSVPENALPSAKYNDTSANSLTKCVIDFLNMSGHQAERINTMGRYVDNRKTVTDVIGRTRTVGSGKYIKGTGTKGSADISATLWGRAVKLEIKWDKDRQSEAQKRYQEQIENAGGIYIIVKDFDSFIEWYEAFRDEVKQVNK